MLLPNFSRLSLSSHTPTGVADGKRVREEPPASPQPAEVVQHLNRLAFFDAVNLERERTRSRGHGVEWNDKDTQELKDLIMLHRGPNNKPLWAVILRIFNGRREVGERRDYKQLQRKALSLFNAITRYSPEEQAAMLSVARNNEFQRIADAKRAGEDYEDDVTEDPEEDELLSPQPLPAVSGALPAEFRLLEKSERGARSATSCVLSVKSGV